MEACHRHRIQNFYKCQHLRDLQFSWLYCWKLKNFQNDMLCLLVKREVFTQWGIFTSLLDVNMFSVGFNRLLPELFWPSWPWHSSHASHIVYGLHHNQSDFTKAQNFHEMCSKMCHVTTYVSDAQSNAVSHSLCMYELDEKGNCYLYLSKSASSVESYEIWGYHSCIRIMVFCDVTLRSLIDSHHHSGRTCREDGGHQVSLYHWYLSTKWHGITPPDGKRISSLHIERRVSWVHIITIWSISATLTNSKIRL
jgi:hypothetical protein